MTISVVVIVTLFNYYVIIIWNTNNGAEEENSFILARFIFGQTYIGPGVVLETASMVSYACNIIDLEQQLLLFNLVSLMI